MKRAGINLIAISCILLGIVGIFIFGIGGVSSSGSGASRLDTYSYSYDIDASLAELGVHADQADVHIRWVWDEQNRIELTGQSTKAVINRLANAGVHNGKLEIDYGYKEKLWEKIKLFDLGGTHHQHELIIHASPDMVLRELDVDIDLGDFTLEGGAYSKVEVDSNMGDMNLQQMKADIVSLNTDAGDILTDQVDAVVQVESSLGEVSLRQTTQSVEVESSMGDVNIGQSHSHNITVDSSMGDVDIKVSPDFEGRYDLKASLGDIRAPGSNMSGNHVIKVNSSAGDIDITQ